MALTVDDIRRVQTVRLGAPDVKCSLLDVIMCSMFLKRVELKGVDADGALRVHIHRDTNHVSVRFMTTTPEIEADMSRARAAIGAALCKFGKRHITPWQHGSALGTFAIITSHDLDAAASAQISKVANRPPPPHKKVTQSTTEESGCMFTLIAREFAVESPHDLDIVFELLSEVLQVALREVHSAFLPWSIYGLPLLVQIVDRAPIPSLFSGARPPVFACWAAQPSALAALTQCPHSPRFMFTTFPTSAAGLMTVAQGLVSRTRELRLDWHTGQLTMTTQVFVLELFTPLHKHVNMLITQQLNALMDRIAGAFPAAYVRAQQKTSMTSVRICSAPTAAHLVKTAACATQYV